MLSETRGCVANLPMDSQISEPSLSPTCHRRQWEADDDFEPDAKGIFCQITESPVTVNMGGSQSALPESSSAGSPVSVPSEKPWPYSFQSRVL